MDQWYVQNQGTIGGSEADIKIKDPYVDVTNGSGYNQSSAAWTSVLNIDDSNNCGGACSYAQVGWQEYGYNSGTSEMDTFFEWADAEGDLSHSTKFECSIGNVNDIWTYTVLWNNAGPGQLTFDYHGGSQCGGNPKTDWTPTGAIQAAETKDLNSQMAGGYTTGYHESFSAAGAYYSGTWNNFNGKTDFVPTGDSQYFGQNATTTQYFETWDKTCSQ